MRRRRSGHTKNAQFCHSLTFGAAQRKGAMRPDVVEFGHYFPPNLMDFMTELVLCGV